VIEAIRRAMTEFADQDKSPQPLFGKGGLGGFAVSVGLSDQHRREIRAYAPRGRGKG